MKNWLDSDFFGFWKETQERAWKSISRTSGSITFPNNTAHWQQPGFKNLAAWGETAIKQSLAQQFSWLEQWAERTRKEAGNLETFPTLMDQVNQSMEGWTRSQKELWGFWFNMLESNKDMPNVPKTYKKNLEVWKSAVHESLQEQSNWLTKWQEQVNYKPLVPEELDQLTAKLNEAMHGWIQNQAELWQHGFEFLETGEIGVGAAPAPAQSGKPSDSGSRDNLKKISGIGPALEKKLNDAGIYRYRQIADLTQDEMDRLETAVGFPGRIQRDKWVEQARGFCSGQ